jgi:hypothetical protein
MKMLLGIALVLIAARGATAQVIYEPVQYQYGGQYTFYYGGSDPAFFSLGHGRGEQAWGRVNGFAFYSSTVEHFREVTSEPLRVYSDAIPYENAAIYGYTANDARMAAYGNVPRYFRKEDLLAAGVVQGDGTIVVVAAQAQPRAMPARGATTRPTVAPILIIPGGQLLPAVKSNNVVIVKN